MVTCKTKRWGNSIGIIVPKDIIKQLNLKSDEEIDISIQKKGNVLKDMFNTGKFSKPGKDLLKDIRDEDSSDMMRF